MISITSNRNFSVNLNSRCGIFVEEAFLIRQINSARISYRLFQSVIHLVVVAKLADVVPEASPTAEKIWWTILVHLPRNDNEVWENVEIEFRDLRWALVRRVSIGRYLYSERTNEQQTHNKVLSFKLFVHNRVKNYNCGAAIYRHIDFCLFA